MARKADEIGAVLDVYNIADQPIDHPVYPGSRVTRYGVSMDIAVQLHPWTERLT